MGSTVIWSFSPAADTAARRIQGENSSNCADLQDLRHRIDIGWGKFLLDMLKQHRLGFADVSISAWVWIYTCLRITICKRKSKEELSFAS